VQLLFDRSLQPVFSLTRRVLPFVGEKWTPLAALLLLGGLRLALVLVFHPASGG
jgi:hypothetical protein